MVFLAALYGVTLSSPLNAADYLFCWNASADPSITAYGVYQRIGDSSYEKIDEVRTEDLDDPARPSYLVTGLGEGNSYWFAAPAISASNAGSDISNETCVTVNGQAVECPDEDGAAIIVSCFIRASDGGISQRAADR